MISVDERIRQGYWGHWGHVFQGANTQWLAIFEPRIRAGNFFLGLQAHSSHIFDAQIPAGSVILSATLEVTAHDTSGGAITIPLSTVDRDTYYSQPLILPFEVWEGNRKDYWTNQTMGALSTTFTAIAGAASAPANGSWIMSQIQAPGATLDNRQAMAQLTPTRTGNMTVASIFYELFRTGNPTGSLRVRIQGVVLDQYGEPQPDGIDVAVTDDILASSVPLGPAASTIAFTFTTNPTLVAQTDYFWIIEHDYSANNVDHISVRHYNAFFNVGSLYHYGEGLGGDWQNYPGAVDWLFGGVGINTPALAGPVNWALPTFFTNLDYTSPDISTLVQAQVSAPWYTPDSGILIACEQPNSGTVNRNWRSAQWPLSEQPRLQVTYIPRRVMLT